MASNNRTPKSVLNAPVLTPIPMSLQLGIIDGQTRAGRRHVMLDEKGHEIPMAASITIPKAARVAATNVPLTRDQSWRRRSKKAIRHALRFT